jgi:AcrR family transcriptional regulator
VANEPAFTRLHVDERRRQLIDAGARLFAVHAVDQISMRQIAAQAGVSKALLYHYFPSKAELFRAAVEEYTDELARVIEPSGEGSPLEQLAGSLDRYLAWIEQNAGMWTTLMRSSASLPGSGDAAFAFRAATMERILAAISGDRTPPPALRNALEGWLGYADAAILDWLAHGDLERGQLASLLLTAFGSALGAARHLDPSTEIGPG